MPMRTKEEQRKYQREWVARRRQKWLADNGPCVRCGSWDDLRVDHADASMKISHSVWSWREERRLAELAKCQVLCEPCHKIKTKECREHARGERVGTSKLTTADIESIRERSKRGEKGSVILLDYPHIFRSTIYKILSGETWKAIADWVPPRYH